MSARLFLSVRPCSATAGPALLAQRTIASTTAQLRHKESLGHASQEELDRHKQDSLSKQASGRGHWKPELASDSEEAVRAERSSTQEAEAEASSGSGSGGRRSGSDPETIRRLQERTKAAAEETSKAGTSMRDGL